MPLSKIQGINGQVTPNFGRRNLIINGAMQIFQRGSQTGLTNAYTGVDRFKFISNGGSVVTGTQGGTSVSTPANGFPKSLHIDVTTADTSVGVADYALVRTTLEGQDLQNLKYGTSSAETVTLSFWVKSPKTGTHWVELFTFDGSKFNSASYTVSSANTWEKKTLSFVGETATAIADDNTAGMLVQWWLLAGSNYTSGTHPGNTWHTTTANRVPGQVNAMDSTSNNFYLTGVQFEVGSAATEFEHRSFGEELQLCKRYFQKTYPLGTNPATATENAWAWYGTDYNLGDTGTFQTQGIRFETEMRAAPTMTLYDGQANSGKCTRYRVGVGPSHNQASNADLITAKNFRHFGQGTSGTGNIAFHYTAVAEL